MAAISAVSAATSAGVGGGDGFADEESQLEVVGGGGGGGKRPPDGGVGESGDSKSGFSCSETATRPKLGDVTDEDVEEAVVELLPAAALPGVRGSSSTSAT